MTKLLEKAFEEASRLPEMDQNALAKWVLDEMQSERVWARTFAESEDVLEKLADEAIAEKRKGKAIPLDLNRLWNRQQHTNSGSAMMHSRQKPGSRRRGTTDFSPRILIIRASILSGFTQLDRFSPSE